MRSFAFLVILCASVLFADEAVLPAQKPEPVRELVKSVEIHGSGLKVNLSTRPGQPLDQATLREDVKTLWNLGKFEDISVKTTPGPDGTVVVFEVVEKAPQPPAQPTFEAGVEPNFESVENPAPSSDVVKSVDIHGTDLKIKLSTRPGQLLDQATLRKDVKTLWTVGRFGDIRVKTTPGPDGTAVIFEVVEKPTLLLHEMRLEPHTFGMQASLPPGTPMDNQRAQQVASQVHKQLLEKGYVDAVVDPELKPLGHDKADLLIHVKAGDSVRVKKVEIEGHSVFEEKQILRALSALRTRQLFPGIPHIWNGLLVYPAYSDEAVQSDLARLQSFYIERGYFDARVALENKEIQGADATVRLFVNAGRHYTVNQVEISGKGIETNVVPFKNGIFVARDVCTCLLRARREAEKKGIVDYSARINFQTLDNTQGQDPVADLRAMIDQGRNYTINRIELQGLHHYSEANTRRNLLLDEGDVMDQTLLRKSLARLNQTQMFEAIDESQVILNTDDRHGTANITIPLRERRRGVWNFSGPVGPISFAGPLQFSLASRLPPWGRGIYEASTYYLSFNVIGYAHALSNILPLTLAKQGILPIFAISRPFTPGEGLLSGFMFAPQVGWPLMVYSYAAAQLTGRLVPILQGNRRFVPQLSVTFERPNGDGVLLCEPPQDKYHLLRQVTSVALQFAASAPMF